MCFIPTPRREGENTIQGSGIISGKLVILPSLFIVCGAFGQIDGLHLVRRWHIGGHIYLEQIQICQGCFFTFCKAIMAITSGLDLHVHVGMKES